MNYKTYLLAIKALPTILLCASMLGSTLITLQGQTGRPNIIFILADDWGYGDLGCHGSTFIKTPNLDNMAAEGIDFQNFSVANPVCSPSRTAIMTGHFPARHSIHGHFASVESHVQRNMPDWLNPRAPMLPRMLNEAGYATAHFGKWHLTNIHVKDGPSPLAYGYDEFDCFNLSAQFKQMHPDSTIFRSIDFIERHQDRPFFINVWIHATHTPHYPKEKYLSDYDHLGEQQQVYAAITSEADDRIGLLFSKLEELGLDEKTLVVFSSDNGPERTGKQKISPDASTGEGHGTFYSVGETSGLKGRKRSLYAGGVRTPFIVRWPAMVPPGQVDHTTALAAVDLLPTFCEVGKVPLPQDYQADGVSIVPAMMGQRLTRKRAIYWQWLYPSAQKHFWPMAAIQEENWKLMLNPETGRKVLFNIREDWGEQDDVIEHHPEKVKMLMAKLEKWQFDLPTIPSQSCLSASRKSIKE